MKTFVGQTEHVSRWIQPAGRQRVTSSLKAVSDVPARCPIPPSARAANLPHVRPFTLPQLARHHCCLFDESDEGY